MKRIYLILFFAIVFACLLLLVSCDQVTDNNCSHEYETTSIGAACEHGAVNIGVCTKCGDRIETVSAPLGHDFEEKVVSATCTDAGYTEYTCDCGASYKSDIVSAKGHYYKETPVVPTCTEAGYMTYTCRNCAYTYEVVHGSPTGHSLKSDVIAPTCDTPGYSRYYCENCDLEFLSDYCNADGHKFTSLVTLPSCDSEGYTTFVCVDCSYSFKSEYIEPLGHNFTSSVTMPNCDTEGYTTYSCSTCTYGYVADYTEPIGHKYSSTIAFPTCETEGYTTFLCDNCSHSFKADFVAANGHKYKCELTMPECLNEGFTTYTCEFCSHSYKSDYIQPIGHNFIAVPTLPTCDAAGFTIHTCENCTYSYTSDFVDPLGHSFVSETISVADCTTSGEVRHTCECGYSYSEITAPHGHDFSIKTVAPTVSDMGYTEFSCDCGFNYVGNYRFYSDILDNAYAGNDQVVAHGIDISKWNHTVDAQGNFEPLDWVALKEAGVDYVILKIGSTPREDGTLGGIEPTFEMDYYGAKAAGIDVGVYYFTYAESVSQIRKDAQYVLEWLEGKQFEYPIYLDLENSPTEDYFPSEIAAPILTEMCLTFFSKLQKEGYYTGLYVNNEFLFNVLQTENMIELFEIWYARYPSIEQYVWSTEDVETFIWDTEKYGEHLGMWQYSMTGVLSPITHNVDFNYAYKDYPSLIRQHGFNGLSKEEINDQEDHNNGTEPVD